MLDQSGGRPLREQSTATHTEIRVLLFGGSGVGKSMRNVQHDRMWLSHRLRQSGRQDLHGRQRVRLEPGHLQRWRHLRQHGRFVHLHLPTGTNTRRDGHSMHRSTSGALLPWLSSRHLHQGAGGSLPEERLLLQHRQSLGSRLRFLS